MVSDFGRRFPQRGDLGMRCRVAIGYRAISRTTDYAAFHDYDRAHRHFAPLGCQARFCERRLHENHIRFVGTAHWWQNTTPPRRADSPTATRVFGTHGGSEGLLQT